MHYPLFPGVIKRNLYKYIHQCYETQVNEIAIHHCQVTQGAYPWQKVLSDKYEMQDAGMFVYKCILTHSC